MKKLLTQEQVNNRVIRKIKEKLDCNYKQKEVAKLAGVSAVYLNLVLREKIPAQGKLAEWAGCKKRIFYEFNGK